MKTEQIDFLEELCLEDRRCVNDVIMDEAYEDEAELVELKERLTLLNSIFGELQSMKNYRG